MTKECPYHENKKWCEISAILDEESLLTGDIDRKILDLWDEKLKRQIENEEKTGKSRYKFNSLTYDYFTNSNTKGDFDKNILIASKCLNGFKFTRYLGSGVSSTVYEACRGANCKYIVRVQPIEMPFEFYGYENPLLTTPEKIFLSEAEITKRMGDLGIGPVVQQIEICRASNLYRRLDGVLFKGWLGLIIMDKLDVSLADFLRLPIANRENVELIQTILNKKIEKMVLKGGIVHNDISRNNIMIKLDPFDAYFIDFGEVSTPIDQEEALSGINKMKVKVAKILGLGT
jgi:serine/threonine protein kinase